MRYWGGVKLIVEPVRISIQQILKWEFFQNRATSHSACSARKAKRSARRSCATQTSSNISTHIQRHIQTYGSVCTSKEQTKQNNEIAERRQLAKSQTMEQTTKQASSQPVSRAVRPLMIRPALCATRPRDRATLCPLPIQSLSH